MGTRVIKRFLRLKEVSNRVGYSRSRIYELVKAGQFPIPLQLGGRAIAWLESDVDTWMDARVAASREKQKGN